MYCVAEEVCDSYRRTVSSSRYPCDCEASIDDLSPVNMRLHGILSVSANNSLLLFPCVYVTCMSNWISIFRLFSLVLLLAIFFKCTLLSSASIILSKTVVTLSSTLLDCSLVLDSKLPCLFPKDSPMVVSILNPLASSAPEVVVVVCLSTCSVVVKCAVVLGSLMVVLSSMVVVEVLFFGCVVVFATVCGTVFRRHNTARSSRI